MVDTKKIGISQGVEISFLSGKKQEWELAVIQETGEPISNAQAAKLKEYGKNCDLTMAVVQLLLADEKPKERKVVIKRDKINKYFPADYSSEEIEGVIIRLLEEWKDRQLGDGRMGGLLW